MKEATILIVIVLFLQSPVFAMSENMERENENVVLNDQAKDFPFVAKNNNKKVKRTSDSPWQLKKIRRKARRNYRRGTPNPSKSNFTWWQRTRLYYKIKARRAKRNATYNKADAPRNRKFNRKRAIRRNSKGLPFFKKLKKRRK
jgi:hypothetical protein